MSKLKALRESKGLTQIELAEASGVPQSTISRLEGDCFKKGTSIRNMVKIANSLNVPVTELLNDEPTSKEVS